MEKLNLSRRNFIKMAVATGSIAALSSGSVSALAADTTSTATAGEIKRIRTVCRACGKMECGVWVTVQDGKAMLVEGDQTCFTSQGHCCTKSQSSIQACYHPDRLRYPMKRTGAKYEDPAWERVTWDEAMQICAKKFQEIKDKYTGTATFGMNGTSRMWSMGGYGVTNMITGGKNTHVASCVCKGPRFLTTSSDGFYGGNWMTSGEEPDVYVEWGGNIEYSNYDDSCRNVVNASQKAKTFIIVDPRLTGIGKEADYWLNVRPGTDQAIALAWAKIIIDNHLTDDLYLKRWTVAPFLVCLDKDYEPTGGRLVDNSGYHDTKTRLLKQSDIDPNGDFSKFLVLDQTKIDAGAEGNDRFSYYDVEAGQWEGEFITTDAAMSNGEWAKVGTVWKGWLPTPTKFDSIEPVLCAKDVEITTVDGKTRKFTTTFQLLVEMLADKTPQWAEARTGVDANKIEKACLAWATPLHPERGYGNGGIHISLAMDQNGMNYQTIRTIMMLVHLTGQFDTPGSNRGPTHAYYHDEANGPITNVGAPWNAMASCKFINSAQRIGGDKWPMTRWYSQWTEPNSLMQAALTADPYPIVGGCNDSGSFMNQGSSTLGWDGMNSLDFWLEANLWHHPTADCADILVPAYHWLEMEYPRISQGPHCGLAMNWPCVEAPGECRSDPMFLKSFAIACGVAWDANAADKGASATLHDACVRMYTNAQQRSRDSNGEFLPWETWDEFHDNFQKNGWVNSKVYYPK
ncbi:MAG: molybdopterin-dependent oxidoreductase, partial [Eggerthellaceae bacterium]|nr:molybdopterin-dependent oxidoreductase [Eggerthellaceae bacterium]